MQRAQFLLCMIYNWQINTFAKDTQHHCRGRSTEQSDRNCTYNTGGGISVLLKDTSTGWIFANRGLNLGSSVEGWTTYYAILILHPLETAKLSRTLDDWSITQGTLSPSLYPGTVCHQDPDRSALLMLLSPLTMYAFTRELKPLQP